MTPEGNLLGVFGTDPALKDDFLNTIAKKSEVEGVIIYHRAEGGKRFSFLDDAQFPERIQGYSRIASLCDHAYYLFPRTGKLSKADGELAVLLQAFHLPGSFEVIGTPTTTVEQIRSMFKGTDLSSFQINHRDEQSSVIDLSNITNRRNMPESDTLIYIDRTFNVKGVGVVVLGFLLSGKVAVHDKLRTVPLPAGRDVEVKGIQINDVDEGIAGRGIRIGLSLKGIEVRDLQNTTWLDDGSLELRDWIDFEFSQSPFYKQRISGRDLHLQLPGEVVVCKISEKGSASTFRAKLADQVPLWNGMQICVLDLNSNGLRVAGGGETRVE